MANWSEKRDPIPDRKDAHKYKQFLENKYKNKRWSEEAGVDSDSSSDKKKKKKKKEKKKAKKVESSSDDSDKNDDEQEEEIVVPTKVKEVKKGSRKLGAPPGFKAPPQAAQQPQFE